MKLAKIPPQYRWTIKRRLRVLAYVEEHSLRAASHHFGLDRKTVRAWRDRWRVRGLKPSACAACVCPTPWARASCTALMIAARAARQTGARPRRSASPSGRLF